jgi:hypothetical protein
VTEVEAEAVLRAKLSLVHVVEFDIVGECVSLVFKENREIRRVKYSLEDLGLSAEDIVSVSQRRVLQ